MTKVKYNRSKAMKNRHAEAKEHRALYSSKYGSEKSPKYFNFLKNKTPLEQNIQAYEVSFQISYMSASQSFKSSSPTTFVVYGFKGQEGDIIDRTMNMILDSRGAKTGANFQSGTINMIKDNTSIDIKPRGMEESNNQASPQNLRNVVNSGYDVQQLDSEMKFKNKKGAEGKMNLDIRHFI